MPNPAEYLLKSVTVNCSLGGARWARCRIAAVVMSPPQVSIRVVIYLFILFQQIVNESFVFFLNLKLNKMLHITYCPAKDVLL